LSGWHGYFLLLAWITFVDTRLAIFSPSSSTLTVILKSFLMEDPTLGAIIIALFVDAYQ
jgi:hypothetical protein